MRGKMDRIGRDFGLKNGRDRLRFTRQSTFHPTKLWRIERRQLHHGYAHVAFVVQQFAAQRFGETFERMFGRAVGRLQRDCAICEGGTDLHDHTVIAHLHSLQSRQRSVHGAEISHLGDATIILRRHFVDRRKH